VRSEWSDLNETLSDIRRIGELIMKIPCCINGFLFSLRIRNPWIWCLWIVVILLLGETMNIFELTVIASPLVGAIAGGVAVKTPGIGWLMLGVTVGFVIGLALYLVAIALSGFFARFCMSEKLNPVQWLASLTAVLLPAACPFAAGVLSFYVVSRLMHLCFESQ
jgi:hypothetical protein